MDAAEVSVAADRLLAAEADRRAIPQLTSEWPGMTEHDAYAIQRATLSRRVKRGERVVGIKLGLTSRAKQAAMGIDRPTLSWLTDAMELPSYTPVCVGDYIHPRAEPEIAFVLGEELRGVVSAARALAAVATVHAAIELIDSRYADFKFRIEDTIADNSSSGGYFLNPQPALPSKLDLFFEAVLLEERGIVVDSATGAAVFGHPAEALAWAASELDRQGMSLPAGSVVLTGGMTDAIPLRPGVPISARFSNLGAIDVRVSKGEV